MAGFNAAAAALIGQVLVLGIGASIITNATICIITGSVRGMCSKKVQVATVRRRWYNSTVIALGTGSGVIGGDRGGTSAAVWRSQGRQ